jgi:hypothetical protein
VQKHDIAVLSVNPLKTIAGQGYTMNINVTVANQGDFTETFNATIYINTTPIETKQITLTNGASKTITYTWNTTSFNKGNYTLWAYAWPVPGETDTADNTFIDGLVIISIPGDINADTYVNVKDAVLLGAAFGSKPGDQSWNPNADINNDGFINVKDAVILGANFGKTDP